MKDNIVIFGAGKWGIAAYHYYKQDCNIICFLDNNKKKWSENIEGVSIYNPEKYELNADLKIKVVIANKHHVEEIKNQLYEKWGITSYILFKVSESVSKYREEACDDNEKRVIIEFEGGLGNQMFQYAFSKCFKNTKVEYDISSYNLIGRRRFVLNDVFPKTECTLCKSGTKRYYKEKGLHYQEDIEWSGGSRTSNLRIVYAMEGYFEGYWQSYTFANLVHDTLRNDFEFKKKEELFNWIDRNITNYDNTVSIHFRAGDYMVGATYENMGSICNANYYREACSYIEKHIMNPRYIVISDDLEMAKSNLPYIEALYVEEKMFDEYEDWYDMCISSRCSHNIIANSTFSWWGAWLNCNEEKIVIAPRKWGISNDIADICPHEWVRI